MKVGKDSVGSIRDSSLLISWPAICYSFSDFLRRSSPSN
jgi:hypothetical protein